jgi:hypothetical protein
LGHSEKEHCEELVDVMLPMLAQRGIEWKVRGTGSLSKHINEATAWGADLYVPIHTNAASGTARGTRFGFYPGRQDSAKACKTFKANWIRIYPYSDRVKTTTYTFAEAKSPRCPSVYCELIFHDNRDDAVWFHANTERIAFNLVESIADVLGVGELPVRIKLTRDENATFYSVPVGAIITLDMETYLLGVVPAEIGNAPIEACKAQAVAARSFGYVRSSAGIIDDTTMNQAYRAPRAVSNDYPNAHQAVKETAGQMLYYGGKVATTYYSHSNGGRVMACHEVWSQNIPYLVGKFDPWTVEVKNGHGVGMSQMGAIRAAEAGLSYKEILQFYYPGTLLDNESEPVKVSYTATVNTKNPLSLNLWNNTNKNASLKLIPRGDTVDVIEEVNNVWAKIRHNGMEGFADRQYLVKVDDPPAPEPIDYKAFALELSGIADRLRVISAALEG